MIASQCTVLPLKLECGSLTFTDYEIYLLFSILTNSLINNSEAEDNCFISPINNSHLEREVWETNRSH